MQIGEEFGETCAPGALADRTGDQNQQQSVPRTCFRIPGPCGGCLALSLRLVLGNQLWWSRFCFGLPDALKSSN